MGEAHTSRSHIITLTHITLTHHAYPLYCVSVLQRSNWKKIIYLRCDTLLFCAGSIR